MIATRAFTLERDVDVSGVSGTGTVADGIEFPGGECVVVFRGPLRSVGVYPNIRQVEAIHGHAGATRILFELPAREALQRTIEQLCKELVTAAAELTTLRADVARLSTANAVLQASALQLADRRT